MRIVPAATLPLSRWTNGAGRKADIATGDGWMVGFAWLDAHAPFSHYPGRDRTITLVEGPGFALDVAGQTLVVDQLHRPTPFDGGAPTRCRITGPSRVLNAMTDRDRLAHDVTILDGAGPIDPGPIDPGGAIACVLVALAGIRLDGADLAPLDAALLEGPAVLTLPPGGRAACIRIAHAR